MNLELLQGTTPRIALKLYLSSDHLSAATGKTVAITVSKNGAAFANPSAGATNATEIGNGWYYYDPSATDSGTLGPFIVRGTAALCDDSEKSYNVVPAANRGTTNLDAAVSSRLATAGYTVAPTVAQIDTQLIASHGAGSWAAGAAAPTSAQVATAVWQDATAGDFTVANSIGLFMTSAATVDETVAAIQATPMPESYNADGEAASIAQSLYVIMQRLMEFSTTAGVLSVKKLDGETPAYTLTLDSPSAPSGVSRTG